MSYQQEIVGGGVLLLARPVYSVYSTCLQHAPPDLTVSLFIVKNCARPSRRTRRCRSNFNSSSLSASFFNDVQCLTSLSCGGCWSTSWRSRYLVAPAGVTSSSGDDVISARPSYMQQTEMSIISEPIWFAEKKWQIQRHHVIPYAALMQHKRPNRMSLKYWTLSSFPADFDQRNL